MTTWWKSFVFIKKKHKSDKSEQKVSDTADKHDFKQF